MIINDAFKFAFIHIPKCAGTSVRSKLEPFDQSGGMFTSRDAVHQELGVIDYAHIPLFIMERYFPIEYAKVVSYASFALIRDPFERFPSSLSQHLRMYGRLQIQNMRPKEIIAEIDQAILVLQKYSHHHAYLPYQYIHFQRQADYVFTDKQVVNNLFLTANVSEMISAIQNLAGIPEGNSELRTTKAIRTNETMVYRNQSVAVLAEAVKPLLKSIVGRKRWIRLREKYKDLLFLPRDKKLKKLFESKEIKDFISEYYASDIHLAQRLVHENPRIQT